MAKTKTPGMDRFREVGRRLKSRQSTNISKVGVEEMDLKQLRDVEKKFLDWYPKTKSPDKETKRHIYEFYIKPRIEKLSSVAA